MGYHVSASLDSSVGKLFQGGGDCRDFKRYRKLSGHFTGVCGDHDRMRYDVQLCDRAKTDQKGQSMNLYLLAALMIPLQGAIVPIVQMVGAVGGKNNFFVLMLIYVGLNISIHPLSWWDISAVSAGKSTRPPPLTAATCFKPFFELSSRFPCPAWPRRDRGLLKRL